MTCKRNMIPKIIHFCWLSNDEYSDDIKKCMRSWEEMLPDYKIIHWNTKNFDVNICDYTREAFDNKKWAFVSDYIRLYALYTYGGIYLDSDVEVLKSLDSLLYDRAFTGFEDKDRIAAWIFGSEKGNPIFKEFLDYYKNKHFVLDDGTFDMTPNPVPITRTLISHGLKFDNSLQKLDDITIYPMDVLCPFNPNRKPQQCFSERTLVNHYFSGAWKGDEERYLSVMVNRCRKVFPRKIAGYIARFITISKFHGIGIGIKSVYNWKRRKSK